MWIVGKMAVDPCKLGQNSVDAEELNHRRTLQRQLTCPWKKKHYQEKKTKQGRMQNVQSKKTKPRKT